MVTIAVPVLVVVMVAISGHYRRTDRALSPAPGGVVLPSRVHGVVLVSRLNAPAMQALAYSAPPGRPHSSAPNVGAPEIATRDFTVDLAAKQVRRSDGRQVHLTPTEWQLLEALVRQPGVVVAGPDLLREVWGPRYERETDYLRVSVAQLRKKLEPDPQEPRYLLTTPGIGYRFVQETP